jgi:two-component system chemotaxis response regulator CheB
MAVRDIVVIGASAGGVEGIRKLVAGLPYDLPAAVFVTMHITARSDGILPTLIARAGPLEAEHAIDGERIRHGRIYVAPPDYHLLLRSGHVHLSHGPRENLQRPCINAMFRSAAEAYGDRVCGVVLSGLLDDGAAGLWQIQQKNGATIVQDPGEATFRSMPESAIRGLNVQYIVRLAEMAPLLVRLASANCAPATSNHLEQSFAEETAQTCPECGGAMTSARMGELHEFRCHIGHRFGLRTMLEEKAKNVERVLEMALAQSEELSTLLKTAMGDPDGEDHEALRREVRRRESEQETLRSISRNSKEEDLTGVRE